MSSSDGNKVVWIGLVEFAVTPESDLLQDKNGARANVIAWTLDEDDFEREVRALAAYLNLQMIGIEDAEPLHEREADGELEGPLAILAAEVKSDPDAVRYGDFHSWKELNS